MAQKTVTPEMAACRRQVTRTGGGDRFVVVYDCGARLRFSSTRPITAQDVERRLSRWHDHKDPAAVMARWTIVELGGDAYRCGYCGMSFQRPGEEIPCRACNGRTHPARSCCHHGHDMLDTKDPRRAHREGERRWTFTHTGAARAVRTEHG